MKDGMIINVLGTEYTITVKKYDEDEIFERRSFCGYCDGYSKKIVVGDLKTFKGWEHEEKQTIKECQKQILRHEITHAFFNESGLQDSAFAYDGAWAKNEEMVDWFATQGPKIYSAWVQTHCV